MADGKMTLDVSANVQQAVATLQQVVASLKNVESAADKVVQKQQSFATFSAGFLAISGAVQQSASFIKSLVSNVGQLIDIYSQQEQAVSRLDAVMKAGGGSIGYTTAQLVDMAGALQKTTRFGDEAIIPAEQILIATNKLNQDTFPRAISLALDLAEATGTDASAGASKLARALQAPATGYETLKEAGITFTAEEKEQLKQLVATNKELEAQTLILNKVEASYGGVAESVAKTDTGKLTQIKNVWGDIKEGIGGRLLDAISPALETIYGWLLKIDAWLNKTRTNNQIRVAMENGASAQELAERFSSEALVAYKEKLAADKEYQEKLVNNQASPAYAEFLSKTREERFSTTSNLLDEAIKAASFKEKAESNNAGAPNPESNPRTESPLPVPEVEVEPSALEKATAYIEDLRFAISALDEQIDMAGDAAVKKYLESQRQAKVDELAKYEGAPAVPSGGVSAFISENASSSISIQKAASALRIAQAKVYRESVSDISLEAKYLDEIIAALEKEHDELYGVKDAHSELNDYIQANGAASVEFSKMQLKARIDEAKAWRDAAEEGSQEKMIIDEIIAALEKEQKALDDSSKKANSHLESINDFLARYGQPASSLISAGVGLADQLLSNQVDALESALSKMRQGWDRYYSHLKDQHEMEQAALEAKYEKGEISAEEYYDALEGLVSKKQQAEEEQAQNEEALQKRIDDIKRRQFAANKANSIASALISGAGAVVKFLADPGGIAGIVLASMAGVTAAAQVATIAAQQYTPMATGGIVTSPLRALIGEAGPEAIIPLSRADEYGLSGAEHGVIQVNISIGNVYGDEDLSSRIFEGIEHAQKIGALPMWRYSR